MGSYKGNNITKKMPSTDVCVNFSRSDFIGTKSTKHSVENESGKKLIGHRHRRRHYYYPARTIMCPFLGNIMDFKKARSETSTRAC